MKKALAFVMAFAMVAGFFAAVGAEEAKAADGDYYVAGDAALCGATWSANDANNAMTDNGDGTYSKVYSAVAAGTYQFKVTDGTWDNSWGNGSGNYSLVIESTCDVTITFTVDTTTVTATGDGIAEPELPTGYYVAGDAALCGVAWSENNADNAMTDNGNGTWSKVYADVQPGVYAFKVTDGTWTNAWGDNGGNYTLNIVEACDVTITFTVDTTTVTAEGTGISTGPIEYAEVFNVVGDAALAGAAWDTTGATGTLVAGSADGVYTLTVERVPASATPYNFKVVQDVANYGWNGPIVYKTELLTDSTNTESNMAITVSEISDVTFTVTVGTDATTLEVTVTKSALAAEDVEAMIDELPEVDEVTIPDKAAVQAVKDVIAGLDESVAADLDATKAAKVDALLAKIAELEAAAADTANVIIHFKNTGEWSGVNMYAFSEAGNMFGDWPGIAMTEDAENEGWYSAKFEYAEDFTVIFNGTKQTINIPIDVAEEGKTEVWIEMGDLAEEPDEFGNINHTYTLSTEAPEGYVDGDEPVVEVTLPTAGDDEEAGDETGDDETGDDETGDDETADDEEDAATAWDDATLKVHVQMPDAEGWDKLGAYLFGTGETFGWSGGSGELTGAWPGVELLPEVNSENGWYAFGGTFADGYYMLIINNFVSDAEAAEGAEKLQAADLEITDGEYWITLALDEETGKYVATTATEAPEDYDGEGLESVVEDPAGDDETGDDETGDDETGDDVTDGEDGGVDKDQPATGDNAPIAVVTMIALVAGASAVVIRKRRVA